MAFDSELLTSQELSLLWRDPALGIFGRPAAPLQPFRTICALRSALLEISCLPSSRADEAGLIATRALEPYLAEQHPQVKEQG